jgi:hypothetical protein
MHMLYFATFKRDYQGDNADPFEPLVTCYMTIAIFYSKSDVIKISFTFFLKTNYNYFNVQYLIFNQIDLQTCIQLFIPYTDFIMQYILKCWQDSWDQQIYNKLHEIHSLVGKTPCSYDQNR